jgi:hypothetical protein
MLINSLSPAPGYKVTEPEEINVCVAANLYMTAQKQFPIPTNSVLLSKLREPCLATHGGKYTWNLSSCVSEKKTLEPGVYVLVASTFDPGVFGEFKVLLYSKSPIQVAPYQHSD